MRAKVRERSFKTLGAAILKILRTGAFLALMAFSARTVYDFLFRKEIFLIKSVEIKEQNYLTPRVAAGVKQLSGRSIFGFSSRRLETTLKERHAEISEISVRRVLPDRIHISYSLRVPLAAVRNEKELLGMDRRGNVFPLPPSKAQVQDLPEISLKRREDAERCLLFVESWAKEQGRLSKVSSDEFGEVAAEIKPEAPGGKPVSLAWGWPSPDHFREKFERFKAVTADLKGKGLAPRSLDLSGVPHNGGSVLEGRRMVGRVIVTLAKNTGSAISEAGK